MTKNNHGLCLIINNEVFKNEECKNRKGSEKDVDTLEKLFSELGFTTLVETNLSKPQLDKTLTNFAKDNRHIVSEMCIVIVMSHGLNDAIETVDGCLVSLCLLILMHEKVL